MDCLIINYDPLTCRCNKKNTKLLCMGQNKNTTVLETPKFGKTLPDSVQ